MIIRGDEMFNLFKRKAQKDLYPESAKYKKRDFVRFRHRGEIHCGFIFDASLDESGNVIYTIQMGGECPTFVYDYKEESIVEVITHAR